MPFEGILQRPNPVSHNGAIGIGNQIKYIFLLKILRPDVISASQALGVPVLRHMKSKVRDTACYAAPEQFEDLRNG